MPALMTSVKMSEIVLSLSTLDLKVKLSTGCSSGKDNGLLTTSSHQMGQPYCTQNLQLIWMRCRRQKQRGEWRGGASKAWWRTTWFLNKQILPHRGVRIGEQKRKYFSTVWVGSQQLYALHIISALPVPLRGNSSKHTSEIIQQAFDIN